MNHNWYAVITAKVLMATDITSTQKLLIALIANLTTERGYCFASNEYLSECLALKPNSVSECISDLEKKGYLSRVIIFKNGTKEIEKRILTIIEKTAPLSGNIHIPPLSKPDTRPLSKPEDNNKVLITNINSLSQSNLFRKPNIPKKDDVARIFSQNGGTEEMANSFFEKYESVEWFKNGSPIKNFSVLVPSFIINWNKIKNGQQSFTGGHKPIGADLKYDRP